MKVYTIVNPKKTYNKEVKTLSSRSKVAKEIINRFEELHCMRIPEEKDPFTFFWFYPTNGFTKEQLKRFIKKSNKLEKATFDFGFYDQWEIVIREVE